MPANVNLNIDISKKGKGDEEAALGLESVAKAADNAKDELAKLDRKLLETRAAMVAAGKTFSETGDMSPLKSLIRDERQLSTAQKSISRGLDAIKADMFRAGEQSGQGFFASFRAKFASGAESLAGLPAPQGFGQWLAAGAVGAAPAILAAVDGAILAGVGSIGIGAAIVGQVRDPKVSGAFKTLGSEVAADLTEASSSFKGPLLDSAQEFRTAWRSILPGLTADFDALAPAFTNLAGGVSGLITHLMPGFNSALRASVPVLDEIGIELPHLGDAFSSFFRDVAAGAGGGKMAMHDLLVTVEDTVVVLGKLTNAGAHAYEWLHKLPGGILATFGPVAQVVAPLIQIWQEHNKKTDAAARSLNELDQEAYRTATALATEATSIPPLLTAQDKLNQSMQTAAGRSSALRQQLDLLYGPQIAAADASDSYDSALVNLRDTVAANTKSTELSKATIDSHNAAINQSGVTIRSNEAAIKAHKGSVDAHKAAIQSAQAAIESNRAALAGHSGMVDANALSLGTNTKTGLANRAMLEAVAKASVELMVADVNNGVELADATKKHQDRIDKLRTEAANLGFTKDDTEQLIKTYGDVPKNIGTNVTLTGANAVYKQLVDLKIAQLALSQNIDVATASKEVRNQTGSGLGGLARGGRVPGPPSAVDNLIARGPWGALGIATGEFVVNAADTQKALPLLEWINSGMPGFAGGGLLGAWPASWQFPVDATKTKMPTTLAELKAKYALSGLGGAAPSGALAGWIAQAIALAHVPTSWTAPLNTLIQRESGGNPRAINLDDSNAQAGDPSRGLMQTIGSTFNAYRLAGLSSDIYDPISNIVAGIRYILARYGDISHVQQANANLPPMGYAAGGRIPAMAMDSGYGVLATGPNLVMNGTGRREPIWGGIGGTPGPRPAIFNVTVNAGMGAEGQQVGKQVVAAIKQYEKFNGTTWRS